MYASNARCGLRGRCNGCSRPRKGIDYLDYWTASGELCMYLLMQRGTDTIIGPSSRYDQEDNTYPLRMLLTYRRTYYRWISRPRRWMAVGVLACRYTGLRRSSLARSNCNTDSLLVGYPSDILPNPSPRNLRSRSPNPQSRPPPQRNRRSKSVLEIRQSQ